MAKKTDQQDVNGIVVSGATLASIFGLTDRRIRQLDELGAIEKAKRGQYLLVNSIKRYITYLKAHNDIKGAVNETELDLEKERALHERVKREQAELKLAAMKGEMHHGKDVERVMNDMLANFRSRLLSLPTKIAPVLVARDDIATIQRLLSKEMKEALQEFSDYDQKLFYGTEYIDLDDDIEIDGDGDVEEEEKN